MKSCLRILFVALTAVLALSACGPSEAEREKAAADAAAAQKLAAEQVALVLPKDVNDKSAWQKYLSAQVTKYTRDNQATIKANHLYMYYVPAGDSQDAQNQRQQQLNNVVDNVSRGVLPGNLMAFGGPDSKATGDLIADAFKEARDGAFKGVFVVFIGATADQDRIKDALAKCGADYRFVEMK
jgi:hypothetical protein